MKIIAALFAAVLLLAGCSGSGSEEAAPEKKSSAPTDANRQAKAQAEQLAAMNKELEEKVRDEAEKLSGTVKIVIAGGKVTPQGKRVEATVGKDITLVIASDVDEEIHVHSDPEHTYEVKAGDSITKTFRIDTPGQVAVEAHHAGVTIVQLVVRP